MYQRYVHVHMCVSEIYQCLIKYAINRIGGVKFSVLSSFTVDFGFEPEWDQSKTYVIGMCCFSAKHTALRSESLLARNQNKVSEWSDMSTYGLLFQ